MASCVNLELMACVLKLLLAFVWLLLVAESGWMDDRWRGHAPGLTPWRWPQPFWKKYCVIIAVMLTAVPAMPCRRGSGADRVVRRAAGRGRGPSCRRRTDRWVDLPGWAHREKHHGDVGTARERAGD